MQRNREDVLTSQSFEEKLKELAAAKKQLNSGK